MGPWNSPGQNNVLGSCFLLQGIVPTKGSNPRLLYYWRILYHLSHQGSPGTLKGVAYPFSSGSSWPRSQTGVSCTAGGFFTSWAIREASLNKMGRRSKQMFSQRKHTGGQWVHEKMLNIANYQRNAKETTYYLTPVRMAITTPPKKRKPHK